MMRMKHTMAAALVAVVMGLSASVVLAQNNERQNGRPGGFGGDRGGRPNWGDPAAREQFMMDRTKERLEITDDAEWKALQPLVKKVMDAQQAIMSERIRGFMGSRSRGGDDNNHSDRGGDSRRGGFFGGTPSPEAEALQRAIDGKASKEELKAAIAKFQEVRKAKQADLEKAQAELRKVLTLRQEAIATSSGLL